MLFLFADMTILLVSLPAAKTGVGVAATPGIATDTSCAITLPPGPLPCRDYNTNDNIEVDKRCTLQLHLNFLEHFPCNFTIREHIINFNNGQQDELFSCWTKGINANLQLNRCLCLAPSSLQMDWQTLYLLMLPWVRGSGVKQQLLVVVVGEFVFGEVVGEFQLREPVAFQLLKASP